MNKVYLGDCLEVMKTLDANSVDAIVTDPPYGLSFMGKKWDYDVPSQEIWEECLRVLKPGGYLLSFAGTRTQHRMAVRIEDAGFEIRDMIAWVYGSGFPKSLNIGKSIENKVLTGNASKNGFHKLDGERREGRIGMYDTVEEQGFRKVNPDQLGAFDLDPTTEEAKKWNGWGTALKPALEPITVARKPLSEKTVAENVLKWGTGGINIDESRVRTTDKLQKLDGSFTFSGGQGADTKGKHIEFIDSGLGRFPANLIHDNSEEVRECFPDNIKGEIGRAGRKSGGNYEASSYKVGVVTETGFKDNGNASRFFKSIIYQAKASKSERNKGLDSTLTVKYNGSICKNKKEENMVAVQLLQKVISEQELVSFSTEGSGENIMVQCQSDSLSTILTETKRIIELKIYNLLMLSLTNESTQVANSEMEVGGNLAESVADLKRWLLTTTKGNQELALGASRVVLETLQLISEKENWKNLGNFHSTVKPIALMEYLIKMVTPKGGIVLDPFAGSGSTLVAAKNLGFNYIGIELTPEYIPIIEARLKDKPNLFNL